MRRGGRGRWVRGKDSIVWSGRRKDPVNVNDKREGLYEKGISPWTYRNSVEKLLRKGLVGQF